MSENNTGGKVQAVHTILYVTQLFEAANVFYYGFLIFNKVAIFNLFDVVSDVGDIYIFFCTYPLSH